MKLLPGFVIFGGICGTAAAYVSHRLSAPFVEVGSLWWVACLSGGLVALAISAAFILQPSPAHPHRERIQLAGFLVFGFLSISLV